MDFLLINQIEKVCEETISHLQGTERISTMSGFTDKLIKNTVLGILFKVMTIFFTFINRTLFIHILGEQYLGINGLYSNILSVLSLADLGVNSVLMFFLYEPLAHRDEKKLSTLIAYFRKVYYIIAGSVFAVGICLIPFLSYLVNGTNLSNMELVLYYVLFLINTCCSYLAVYKSTMLIADQSAYIVNTVNFTFTVVQSLLQIGVLYVTKNYVFYLLVVIACTLANNALLTIISEKKYPFLNRVAPNRDIGELKKKIFSNIKNVFLYRVGGTVMNSTDNILISILIGTTVVGFYSNYALIITNLTTLLMFFSQAMMASMGNFGVDADTDKKELVFRSSMFIYACIAAFSTACIVSMMNDFMIIWLRDGRYLLSDTFVWVLGFKLFVDIITSPNWTFRESAGLFREVRMIMFLAAVVNLVLSVLLAKPFGLAGIIIATSLSKIVTLFWYEPRTFYRKVFHKPLIRYWVYQTKLLFPCAISIVLSALLSEKIPGSIVGIAVKIVLSACCTVSIFAVALHKSMEYQFCFGKISGIVRRMVRKG